MDKLLVLREIDQDHGLDLATIRRVTKDAKGREEHGDKDHDARERLGELLGFLHRLGDGDDAGVSLVLTIHTRVHSQPDTLEREHGGADEEGELFAVEQHDVLGDAMLDNGADLARRDVHEAHENERVRDESGARELGEVANHGEREEEEELGED